MLWGSKSQGISWGSYLLLLKSLLPITSAWIPLSRFHLPGPGLALLATSHSTCGYSFPIPGLCFSSQNERVRLGPGCTCSSPSEKNVCGRASLVSCRRSACWPVQRPAPSISPAFPSLCTWRQECILAESQVLLRCVSLGKEAAPHFIK